MLFKSPISPEDMSSLSHGSEVETSPVKPRALRYMLSPDFGTPSKSKTPVSKSSERATHRDAMELLSPSESSPFRSPEGFSIVGPSPLKEPTPSKLGMSRLQIDEDDFFGLHHDKRPFSASEIERESFPIEEESAEMEQFEESGSPRVLPTIKSADTVKRVTAETVAALVKGAYAGKIARFLIVDCRYDYEHKGGHIKGAINLSSSDNVEKIFNENLPADGQRVVVVFHCEYSKNRGPTTCRLFRNFDRTHNIYPKLSYPEVVVLDGGYRLFHQLYPDLCIPHGGFISMWDSRYAFECKQRHRESKIVQTKQHKFQPRHSVRQHRPKGMQNSLDELHLAAPSFLSSRRSPMKRSPLRSSPAAKKPSPMMAMLRGSPIKRSPSIPIKSSLGFEDLDFNEPRSF